MCFRVKLWIEKIFLCDQVFPCLPEYSITSKLQGLSFNTFLGLNNFFFVYVLRKNIHVLGKKSHRISVLFYLSDIEIIFHLSLCEIYHFIEHFMPHIARKLNFTRLVFMVLFSKQVSAHDPSCHHLVCNHIHLD